MKKKTEQLKIEVCAHWVGLDRPITVGFLYATPSRGKEIFSFEYEKNWIESSHAQALDPSLQLLKGQQYAPDGQGNFGIFLDSSPDRWGRLLMQRREAQSAREEKRAKKILLESDYLLGVFDHHRMGALRFRFGASTPFLDDHRSKAIPPFTSLRELEHASLELEKDHAEENPSYSKWLRMLMDPGASLGGARPKAGVMDAKKQLWIAKFPSRHDETNIGAWEKVVHQLALCAGIRSSESEARKLSGRFHTFLTKRFDRSANGERIHFASAMTLLQKTDGEEASYLDLVEFIMRQGANAKDDLEELWRRIVFFICVSNVDDHLRNHGFLLEAQGWRLAPAYDMNPSAFGNGLKLNISENDNSQDLELAKEVAKQFRVNKKRADEIILQVVSGIKKWRKFATELSISKSEQERMSQAFRAAEGF